MTQCRCPVTAPAYQKYPRMGEVLEIFWVTYNSSRSWLGLRIPGRMAIISWALLGGQFHYALGVYSLYPDLKSIANFRWSKPFSVPEFQFASLLLSLYKGLLQHCQVGKSDFPIFALFSIRSTHNLFAGESFSSTSRPKKISKCSFYGVGISEFEQ